MMAKIKKNKLKKNEKLIIQSSKGHKRTLKICLGNQTTLNYRQI